jgi:hypothetical protein
MHYLNYIGQYLEAAHWFGLAATLCRIEQRVGHFPRVGWPERATLHQGLALLRSGRHGEALRLKEPASVPVERRGALYRGKIIAHAELEQYEAVRDFLFTIIGDETTAYRRRWLAALRCGVRQVVERIRLLVSA